MPGMQEEKATEEALELSVDGTRQKTTGRKRYYVDVGIEG
jgi:hypothetical protein